MPISKDLKDLDTQLKKTSISAESFKRGSSFDTFKNLSSVHKNISSLSGHTRKLVMRVSEIEKTVNNNSKKISLLKNISKTQTERIGGKNIGAKLPGNSGSNQLKGIIDSLDEIINILKLQNKQQKNAADAKRKEAESARRSLAESALEKGFVGAIKVAEKVLAPVKSLLSRIIDFFLAIFLGNFVLKLLDWFADKKNQDKIKAIGRFFGDHWPKLLALYLRFGTGLGRFVGGLSKVVFFGMRKLLQIAAQLVGAKGAARFLGGKGGKLVQAGLTVATTVGSTMALSSGIENFAGMGDFDSEQKEPEPPKFSGGGFANFKNLFGYFGGGPGFVNGQKGIDKVPAMLSDGEFVMSRGAVQKYGVDTLEAMNAAGGGTNRPKIAKGTTYAAGGGSIGDKPKKMEIEKESESGLVKPSGVNTSPIMTSPEDMNKMADQIRLDERLKRIESQMQSQRALASGKGINIRGASFGGAQLGTGYGAKYQGRDSIVIKGGAKNFSTGIGDKEVTLAGKRYFAQKRGNDVIYSAAKTGGSLVGGAGLKSIDKKKLPPTQIMMGGDGKPFVGFLAFEKGNPVYKRGAEPGAGTTNPLEALGRFLNPNAYKESDEKTSSQKFREGATNSLDYYRKQGMSEDAIKRQMKSLGQDYDRAKNDLEYRNKGPDLKGKLSPRQQMRAKISKSQKKPTVPTPPQKPKVSVKVSGYSGGQRGSGSKPSTGGKPRTPNFGATCPSSNAPKNKKILGIF